MGFIPVEDFWFVFEKRMNKDFFFMSLDIFYFMEL